MDVSSGSTEIGCRAHSQPSYRIYSRDTAIGGWRGAVRDNRGWSGEGLQSPASSVSFWRAGESVAARRGDMLRAKILGWVEDRRGRSAPVTGKRFGGWLTLSIYSIGAVDPCISGPTAIILFPTATLHPFLSSVCRQSVFLLAGHTKCKVSRQPFANLPEYGNRVSPPPQ
jgi:hypothetical protein